jgi:multidrug efflux pump subunit AcrA (membrane-fusion protein)
LFLIESNSSALATGEAVTGFIKVAGDAQSGVVVPRNAVLRKDGATWVYVQTGDDEFTRREVSIERPGADGWFVTRGMATGDKVVTVGAQQLLSEEVKGQIGGD